MKAPTKDKPKRAVAPRTCTEEVAPLDGVAIGDGLGLELALEELLGAGLVVTGEKTGLVLGLLIGSVVIMEGEENTGVDD